MKHQSLAVIGLGAMGFGMASSCLNAGFQVWGIDTHQETQARFIDAGGEASPIDQEFDRLDAVLLVVVNADQAREVMFGAEGCVPKMRKGSVVIASPTVAPSFAEEMEQRCADYGVLYLDAPISGGSIRASEGTLSVMASGSDAAFRAAKPVLNAIAQNVFELGENAGAGSVMKSANQMLAGVHIAVMGEALAFAAAQGIPADQFLDVISKSAGTSWMLENRAPHVVAGDYTPHSKITIWPKDLGIVSDIAAQIGYETPITKTALTQYLAAVDAGLGDWDDAAIAKHYANQIGLQLPQSSSLEDADHAASEHTPAPNRSKPE